MKLVFIFLVIACFQSYPQEYYIKNLYGIKSFIVGVVINEDLEEAGIRNSVLQNDVELKLRTNGINVVDSSSGLFPDAELHIYIWGKKLNDELVVFNCQISVYEYVNVERLNTNKYFAITWNKTGGGYVYSNQEKFIRDTIKDEIDVLLNNYFKDNPK